MILKKIQHGKQAEQQQLLRQLELCRVEMFNLGNLLMYDHPDKAIEALGASKILKTWIEGISENLNGE